MESLPLENTIAAGLTTNFAPEVDSAQASKLQQPKMQLFGPMKAASLPAASTVTPSFFNLNGSAEMDKKDVSQIEVDKNRQQLENSGIYEQANVATLGDSSQDGEEDSDSDSSSDDEAYMMSMGKRLDQYESTIQAKQPTIKINLPMGRRQQIVFNTENKLIQVTRKESNLSRRSMSSRDLTNLIIDMKPVKPHELRSGEYVKPFDASRHIALQKNFKWDVPFEIQHDSDSDSDSSSARSSSIESLNRSAYPKITNFTEMKPKTKQSHEIRFKMFEMNQLKAKKMMSSQVVPKTATFTYEENLKVGTNKHSSNISKSLLKSLQKTDALLAKAKDVETNQKPTFDLFQQIKNVEPVVEQPQVNKGDDHDSDSDDESIDGGDQQEEYC